MRASGENNQRRREELLTRLVAMFLAEGFAGFSVAALAERLQCSKTTLYLVASSKEQIVLATIRTFFKQAAERIETRVAAVEDAGRRLAVYLEAVSDELRPATARFYADLTAYPPANEVYQANTQRAADRVRGLVTQGVDSGALRPVHTAFVGAAVAQVMAAIQRGDIGAATGLDDAAAYRELADLVTAGISAQAAPA